jgi:hypothetical protein
MMGERGWANVTTLCDADGRCGQCGGPMATGGCLRCDGNATWEQRLVVIGVAHTSIGICTHIGTQWVRVDRRPGIQRGGGRCPGCSTVTAAPGGDDHE